MPDMLEATVVEPLLRGRFGRPYLYAAECDSTQLLIPVDAPEGAVAVCEHQSAGRGRLGRSWQAPAGTSIHCSLALRPPPAVRAPELTLLGAVAAAEAIEEATGIETQIKWPNDVMLYARKVAGVLGELLGGSVVLGIGINVDQTQEDLPAHARQPAASLRTATGRRIERAPLLAAVLFALETRYDDWRERGLAAVHHELAGRDFLRGREVSVDDVAGRAIGIDASGRLEIQAGSERRLVESGEVHYGE